MSSTMDDPQQLARDRSLADSAINHAEPADEDDEEYYEEEDSGRTRHFIVFEAVPSWAVSMLVHVIAFIVLAFVTFQPEVEKLANVLSVATQTEVEEVEEVELIQELDPLDVQEITMAQPIMQASEAPSEVTEVELSTDVDAVAIQVDLVKFSEQTAPKNDLLKEIGAMTGSALEGRSARARGQMVKQNGGSEGSEKAVTMALKWFARHQLPDGSWSFSIGPCQCTGRGSLNNCHSGATAMALLPFLGAGQTHLEGEYKETVGRGLEYLVRVEKPNGSLAQGGGRMYAHGLASIALCEAYAMTQDRRLMRPAQASLAYIVWAQDPVGGGWRYGPQEAGDTSVVGWQLMALKSGHMGYLQVPPRSVAGAIHFLDSVQAEGGAAYGYTTPGKGAATTAVGLLCRMYLGWEKDHKALQRGVQAMGRRGPDKSNMYFNYYATQVMRHYGGDEWTKWNTVMRDQLVNSQVKAGHMTGSWDIPGTAGHNEAGGRLYVTSMATMILEVYYRHMPLYAKEAAEDDFPL